MKDLPENELFSAYLDGELTATEQAEVEQLLAESPAARQLLDEFRALSSTLQSMPQYALDEDLSDRVLRTAERRMLTDSERLSRPGGNGKMWPSHLGRLLNARALVWSGLAVAIAVMFMLSQPPEKDGGGVAMAPETAEPEAERDKDNAGPVVRAVGGEEDLAAGHDDTLLTDKKAEIAEAVGNLPTGNGLYAGAPDLMAKRGAIPADPNDLARHVAGKTADPTTFEMQKPGEELPGPTGPQVAQVHQPAGPFPVPGPDGGGGAKAPDKDTVGLRTTDDGPGLPGKGAGPYEHTREKGVSLETQLGGLATIHGAQTIGNAISDYASRLEPIDSAYTVVCLDVRSSAVANRAFDQALGKNKILSAARENGTEENAAELESAGLRPQRLDGTRQVDVIEGLLEDLGNHGELALFYVEATPEQIQATVDELTRQPDQFRLLKQLRLASIDEIASIPAARSRRVDHYDDSVGQKKETAEAEPASGTRYGGRADARPSDGATGVGDGVVAGTLEQKNDALKRREDLPAGYVWRLEIPGGSAKAGDREARDAAGFFDVPASESRSSGGAAVRGSQVPTQPIPTPAVPPPAVLPPSVPPPAGPVADSPVQTAGRIPGPVVEPPAPAAEPAVPPSEPEPAPPSLPDVQKDAPATEPALPKAPAPEAPDAGAMRRTVPGSDLADESPSPVDLPKKSEPEDKTQDHQPDAPLNEPGEPQSDPFADPEPPRTEMLPPPVETEGEEFGTQGHLGFAYAEKSEPAAAKVRAFFVLRLVGSEFSTGDVAAGQSAARMAEQVESSAAAPLPADAEPLAAPPPADAHQ